MGLDVYKSIIDDMESNLLLLVLWDWGEPFMHPQLPDMIEYASTRDIRTVTSTNAHFLNNDAYIERILSSGLSTLIVAIDSLHDESYRVYRRKGSLDKAIVGLQNIIRIKKKLGSGTCIALRMVIMKQNEHEVASLRKLAKEIGADRFVVKTLNPSCGSTSMDGELLPKNPKYRRFRHDRYTDQRIHIETMCRRVWWMANILSNGDVVPCTYDYDSSMKVGNVKERPFREIWNSPAYRKLRERIYKEKDSIEKCHNCWINFKLSKSGWFPLSIDFNESAIGRFKGNIEKRIRSSWCQPILSGMKRRFCGLFR
jgi:radical SAM protein with 4Fe4S-binding SPASM domain